MASFRLHYSSLFYDDLDKITDYILHELKNELAARTLINAVEAAIKYRLENPLHAAVYRSIKVRKHLYRRIHVGNYLIFYVVIEDTIVVRRMLYGHRDLDRFL
jgi:toxin ParE1/3/4